MQPKIIVFCCNWSLTPGLRLKSYTKEEKAIIVTACVGKVGAELILDALTNGAWGILIVACPFGDCVHNANYKLARQMLLLKNVLKVFNINDERLRLECIEFNETAKFNSIVNNFVAEIKKLGPIRM